MWGPVLAGVGDTVIAPTRRRVFVQVARDAETMTEQCRSCTDRDALMGRDATRRDVKRGNVGGCCTEAGDRDRSQLSKRAPASEEPQRRHLGTPIAIRGSLLLGQNTPSRQLGDSKYFLAPRARARVAEV